MAIKTENLRATRLASNPLTMKLSMGAELDDNDKSELQRVTAKGRVVEAHRQIVREGDRPENVHVLMSGFACRYKVLANGRRHHGSPRTR